ncbi:MAG: cyanophycin synthetase, partial [bacterium]|nr:cyanophycin synthetase [bacterium]
IVPCWLENLFGKDNIYAALAASAVGLALGLNLVEVSQALKDFKGLPGTMQLTPGIKNSWILDDSKNASPFSMLDSLGILKEINGVQRKIAVLGDMIGVGKYAIEAHEAVGERVKNSADLLFAVGDRAKFFVQGAIAKGMAEDRIFQFNDAISAAKALQSEIKEGDLILIDGSKEMGMIEVVKEIKAGPIV